MGNPVTHSKYHLTITAETPKLGLARPLQVWHKQSSSETRIAIHTLLRSEEYVKRSLTQKP
jgi:hypothetical protein